MTTAEMHRMMPNGTPNRNGRVFQTRYLGREFYREFLPTDLHREREITRPTFMEMNYDELIRLIKQPWFDSEHLIVEAAPDEDAKLTPADTKELDSFLNSFAIREAS